MVFKNFRFHVILRVVMLTLLSTLLAWCLVQGLYLRSVYVGAGLLLMTAELIWYVDRFNREINSFMVSLLHNDFTTRSQSRGRSKRFDELYDSLNRISEAFKTISAEKEIQFRFLEMLVEHLRVGILSLDDTGKIALANQAMKDLLHREVLFSLKSLETVDRSLVSAIKDIRGGETRLVKLRIQNELLQVSIHASEFRLEDKYHKLISMQNIRSELDAREMEAWQKLIRVLTHEIMNSVAPVISLSETMHGLIHQHQTPISQSDPALYETLDKGLDAIKVRSQGLYSFTQSYRKLTGVPKLALQKTNLKAILERIEMLMSKKLEEQGIALTVCAADIPVVADPDLMEHVLINLVLNAADAVAETKEPAIEVTASRDQKGLALISVKDNGEGIDEATSEKIFIPFFTTRKNGSGIGLALTKQILQLHHADIHFTSEIGKGTEFVIVL